ncbi:hypothetical protein GIB67_023637, partial [Kingdonia uniflora]
MQKSAIFNLGYMSFKFCLILIDLIWVVFDLQKMVNLGLVYGKNKLSTASLSFRLPYFTNWGERILVCGSEPVVGSWNVKQSVLLSPSHEGYELIWSGAVTVTI